MAHDSRVRGLHGLRVGDVGVHVDDGEEVEAERRGEAAKERAGEQKSVLVGLMVACNDY